MARLEELAARAQEAKALARPAVSGFTVGAAALGASGAVYQGFNAEFPGAPIQLTLHAEGHALLSALAAGEKSVSALAVTAPPCGFCRQLLLEWVPDCEVFWEGTSLRASSLCPGAFQLEARSPFGAPPGDFGPPPTDADELEEAAWGALPRAFTPFSSSPHGLALETVDGRFFCGSTQDCGAFNPSQPALIQALACWLSAGGPALRRLFLWSPFEGPFDETTLAAAWAEGQGISWATKKFE